MIRINLIPVREVKRKEELQRHFIIVGLMAVSVIVIINYMNFSIKSSIKRVNAEIRKTEEEIKRLETIIGEVNKIKSKKEELERKLGIIKDLSHGRDYAVHILDELSKSIPVDYSKKIPRSIQVTEFTMRGGSGIIKGFSLDHKSLSDFIEKLESSDYFQNPQLKQVKVSAKGPVKLYDFELNVNMERPVEKAAGGGEKR